MIHPPPPASVIVTSFIPLGPPNMGAFAIIRLGSVALTIFPQTKTIHPSAGLAAYTFGVLVGLILWAFSIVWLGLAIGSLYHAKHFSFNISWWAFTFPLGAFALSTISLAEDLPSRFFRVLGAIFSVCVFAIWIVVVIATGTDLVRKSQEPGARSQ